MAKNPAQQAAIAIAMKKAGKKPKSAKKGMKFNPKYTRGSADVGKRKKLMAQIARYTKSTEGQKLKDRRRAFLLL